MRSHNGSVVRRYQQRATGVIPRPIYNEAKAFVKKLYDKMYELDIKTMGNNTERSTFDPGYL